MSYNQQFEFESVLDTNKMLNHFTAKIANYNIQHMAVANNLAKQTTVLYFRVKDKFRLDDRATKFMFYPTDDSTVDKKIIIEPTQIPYIKSDRVFIDAVAKKELVNVTEYHSETLLKTQSESQLVADLRQELLVANEERKELVSLREKLSRHQDLNQKLSDQLHQLQQEQDMRRKDLSFLDAHTQTSSVNYLDACVQTSELGNPKSSSNRKHGQELTKSTANLSKKKKKEVKTINVDSAGKPQYARNTRQTRARQVSAFELAIQPPKVYESGWLKTNNKQQDVIFLNFIADA